MAGCAAAIGVTHARSRMHARTNKNVALLNKLKQQNQLIERLQKKLVKAESESGPV